MTKHFRPGTVVTARFRGQEAGGRTDAPAPRRGPGPSSRGQRSSGMMTMMLAAAAVAGLVAGFSLRRGPPVLAASDMPAGDIPFFGYCEYGGGTNCVVDGNTFYFGGDKVRIANIDAPETHPPRCASEARLGAAATHRLRDLLNAGDVTLSRIDRDEDGYGRKLRNVAVGGADVGAVLVGEGLARDYKGGRRSWCM